MRPFEMQAQKARQLLPRRLGAGGDGRAVIAGVSVISVGSSAVVPNGMCARADGSMRGDIGMVVEHDARRRH